MGSTQILLLCFCGAAFLVTAVLAAIENLYTTVKYRTFYITVGGKGGARRNCFGLLGCQLMESALFASLSTIFTIQRRFFSSKVRKNNAYFCAFVFFAFKLNVRVVTNRAVFYDGKPQTRPSR